jgi:hypothetical protein
MAKHDHQSRDQKRKAKLKKRAERSRKHESLAYSGTKYKTDENTPTFYRTDLGIYESYVMTDRELVDDDVEAAIESLVIQMREGPLPPLVVPGVLTITEGGEEDFIITNIRRNWQVLEEEGTLPTRDELIGILRSILHSIGIWRSQSLHSRGYLCYIEGFMKKLGVSVRKATKDLEPLPDPEEDPLLLIGRAWVAEGDNAAKEEFADEVESLLRSGQAERAINVCQQLMGETDDMLIIEHIQQFAVRGHWALKTEMG